MYDSKMTLSELISTVTSEVDISLNIVPPTFARWVSSLEQLLYTDILKFYRSHDITLTDGSFSISSIPTEQGECECTFDDIVKIYDGPDEIVKSGAIAAYQFENDKSIYWQDGDKVQVRKFSSSDTLRVIRLVRPAIKTADSSETIKVPYEWIDMVLSKVRGEAYKLASDDAQAAKWLNDYNTQLESFKAWVGERQKWYGE